MDVKKRTNWIAIYLFVFLASVYLISISSAFTSRNSGEGFMKITELENLLYTGQLGAPAQYKWGALGKDGRRYSWHQFGQQAIVLPLYLVMRREGYAYYFINLVSTALTAVMVLRLLLLLGFRMRQSVITAVLYGIGTLSWFYASKTPHEHALAILFVMGGMYYAVRYQTGLGRRNLIYSMLAIGVGFTIRYDVILMVFPIALYIFLGRKDNMPAKYSFGNAALISMAVLAPFIAFNLGYNYMRFGDIFDTGIARSHPHIKKHFGVEFIPRGIIGTLFSPGRSIFLFTPLLMLFPFSVKAFKKQVDGRFFIASMVTIVMYILFYSFHHSWDGDWCFGPRYFLVIIPFMIMVIAPLFGGFRKRRAWIKALVILVVVASILVQVVFVSSNSYLSNVIRYGIDDDSQPELSKMYTRDFGEHGSWKWMSSYFDLKYAQFFNQFIIFRYTLLMNLDESNTRDVIMEIRRSHAPFLLLYLNLMRKFDFWWLQERATVQGFIAWILAGIGAVAFIQVFRLARKND